MNHLPLLKPQDITVAYLQSDQFRGNLPEIQELNSVYEYSNWHDETTLDHIIAVMAAFEDWLKLAGLSRSTYMAQPITHNSRETLMRLVIVLHDIGKKETKKLEENGFTSFPNHEVIGARKAESILERFDISKEEKEYVLNLIIYHSKAHIALAHAERIKENIGSLKTIHPELFTDLMIFGMIDMMGSKLKNKNPEAYAERISAYKNILSQS